MTKQPLYASVDQLARVYNQDIIKMLQKIKGQGSPNFLQGEATMMYQLLAQQPEVQGMTNIEVGALFCMAFGVSIKKSAEMLMQQPPDTLKQRIYKIVQDKREAMGLVRSKEAFINAFTLNQLCSQLLKQIPYEQITQQVVRDFLFDEVTKLYQSNWDFNLLNDAYINKAMEKITFLHQNDNDVELLQRFQQQQLLQLQKQCVTPHTRGSISALSTAFSHLKAVPGAKTAGNGHASTGRGRGASKPGDISTDSAAARGYDMHTLASQKIMRSRFQSQIHVGCGDINILDEEELKYDEEKQILTQRYEKELEDLQAKLTACQQQVQHVKDQIQTINSFNSLGNSQQQVVNNDIFYINHIQPVTQPQQPFCQQLPQQPVFYPQGQTIQPNYQNNIVYHQVNQPYSYLNYQFQ